MLRYFLGALNLGVGGVNKFLDSKEIYSVVFMGIGSISDVRLS
jgi:hypothetical protein